MGCYAFFVTCFCLFFSVAGNVQATEKSYPSRLWQIDLPKSKQLKASYLLGTMHLADKAIVNLPPHINRVVDKADSLTVEVKLDSGSFRTMSEYSALKGKKTLSDLIGDNTFNQVLDILRNRGINKYGLQRLKPWVVGLMLNYPPPSLDPVLDYSLQLRFANAGKPVYQLETAEEQIRLFNRLSLQDQVKFLRFSLQQQENFDGYLEAMKRLYLADDLDGLQALANEQMGDVSEPYLEELFQELIDKRNLTMVDRMRVRIHEGNALIAVGALHLTGDYGIIAILRELGYRVVPIRPN